MTLLKTKPKVKTVFFKKALEGSSSSSSFKVPVPYLDAFARSLARGNLEKPLVTLRRILSDLNLEPHSLLGIQFITRGPDENLLTARISNIFEPYAILLGPRELAGKPFVVIANELEKGNLIPSDIKALKIRYSHDALSAMGIPQPAFGHNIDTGAIVPIESALERIIRFFINRVPIETSVLIDPTQPFDFPLTSKQINEVIKRYNVLQFFRRQANLPPASQIEKAEYLYPVEMLYKLMTRRGLI